MTTTIKFLNNDQKVEMKIGDSILDVAEENNIDLDHSCGGNCSCSTCHIFVESGMNLFSPMEEDELGLVETARGYMPGKSRLSCQARLQGEGEISVRIPE